MGLAESVLFGSHIGFYNKELCCPLKQQSFTVVEATRGCVSVRKKRERMLRKHKMGGRDGEMDKCKWREWKPQVSLLIYQQCAWQPLGSKWMCTPQVSGLLLSNGDKEQRERGHEGGSRENAQSQSRGRCLRQDCFVYCTRASTYTLSFVKDRILGSAP